LKVDGCKTTVAEHFGTAYDNLLGIYIALVVVFSIVTAIQNFRIFHAKGFFPLDLQKVLHLMIGWGALGFIIRAIDPFSFAGRMPIPVYAFFEESTTGLVYIILMAVVFSWVRIIWSISGKDKTHSHRVILDKLEKALAIPFFILIVIFAQLQASVYPSWLYRVLKFVLYIVFNVCFAVVGWIHGKLIYTTLRALEVKQQQTVVPQLNGSPAISPQADPVSTTNSSLSFDQTPATHDPVSSSNSPPPPKNSLIVTPAMTVVTPVIASPSSSPRLGPVSPALVAIAVKDTAKDTQSNIAKKRTKLLSLLGLFGLMSVMSVVACVVEGIAVGGSIEAKEDAFSKPLDPVTSVTANIQFEVLQYLTMFLTMFFFRNIIQQKKTFDASYDENAQANKKRKTLKIGKQASRDGSREVQ